MAVTLDAGISSSEAKQLLIRGTASVEIVDGVAPEYFEAAAEGEGGAERSSRSLNRGFARYSTGKPESPYARVGAFL